MATIDQIANHRFLSLIGNPIPPTQQIKVIQRPGVDGTAFLLFGKVGKPFDLISQVDVESMDAGLTALAQYQALIGGTPVTLIQGGVNYAARGYYFEVLSVEQVRLRRILNSSGGLNYPSGAFLEARWQLLGLESVS